MRIVIDLDREENQGYVFTGNLDDENLVTLDGVFVVESWEDGPSTSTDTVICHPFLQAPIEDV